MQYRPQIHHPITAPATKTQNMKIQVEILSKEDAAWYGVPVLLRAEKWFPTDAITKVGPDKRYFDAYGIGYKIRGVMGSASVGIGLHGLERAKQLLAAAGHTVN